MSQSAKTPLSEGDQPDPANKPRPRYRRWLRDAVLLVLLLLGLHFYQTRDVASGIAPALAGVDLQGNRVDLAALRGQPVLVHFWATWCPVCRLEQGSINAIAEDRRVITVALEETPPAELLAYLDEAGLDFSVLRDVDGALARRFGVRGVPASFVVDAAGNIRFTEVGYTTGLGLRFRLWLADKWPTEVQVQSP